MTTIRTACRIAGALTTAMLATTAAMAGTYDEGYARAALKLAGVSSCTISASRPMGGGIAVSCTDGRIYTVLPTGTGQTSVARYNPGTGSFEKP
jgi:hypothetical protein